MRNMKLLFQFCCVRKLERWVGYPEGAAMIRCEPISYGNFPVFYGGIAFIGMPVVIRVLSGDLLHVIIPVGFGKYRCCRDAEVFCIDLNNTFMRYILVLVKTVAIDDQKLGRYR